MYSYEERIRAVNLYIKLGKRLQAALPASEANHDGRSVGNSAKSNRCIRQS